MCGYLICAFSFKGYHFFKVLAFSHIFSRIQVLYLYSINPAGVNSILLCTKDPVNLYQVKVLPCFVQGQVDTYSTGKFKKAGYPCVGMSMSKAMCLCTEAHTCCMYFVNHYAVKLLEGLLIK